ncbi:hypothetical protein B0H17DRAFT_991904 [Mycena rosella]|uniref:DUF7918 domain-containing protein n=1 Tax=Mycena rosella TaxID=1033263 RepID=A0AAD7CS84_MYCRO|nr:hypothetical protein B0H17DRAFT_991904 [Mycena rosella]
MHHHTGFSAWVTIDGKEATEYDVETSEDQKTVTCWIPSELGKRFSVNWTNTSYFNDTLGHVNTDGTSCGGIILYGSSAPKSAKKVGVDSETSLQPFIFSSLDLTDDDAFLGGSESLHKELGVIQLCIIPIRVTQRNVPAIGASLSEMNVHERAKKAVTQQIMLAPTEKLAKQQVFCSSQRTGPDLVKFCFKYRPIDVLQANGIAPLPPRPKRKASVDPPRATPDEDLTDAEEEKNLRHKLKALEAKRLKKEKKPPVKREFEADAVIDLTQPNKRVKWEEKRPFLSGEVIDLT